MEGKLVQFAEQRKGNRVTEADEAVRPHDKFGRRVGELRLARGLTQAQLATRLGTRASWVSQVESGVFFPSAERLGLLAEALGPEVMAAATSDGERSHADTALTAFRKGRIEVLRDFARRGDVVRERRQKFKLLANRLEAVAAGAPESVGWTRGDRLVDLSDISTELPESSKALLLVELSCMQPVAPHQVNFSRNALQDCVELLCDELNLTADSYSLLRTALAKPVREWPDHSSLHPVGGALGALAMSAALGADGLLLAGRDPIGWLGWPAAAGLWLVREVESSKSDDGAEQLDSAVSHRRKIAGLAGAASGISFGLPVAGAGAAALWGGLAGNARKGRARTNRASEISDDGEHDAASALPALAMGPAWLRLELNKLVAVYAAFPDLRQGTSCAEQLPDAASIADTLSGLNVALSVAKTAERDVSETGKSRRPSMFDSMITTVEASEVALRGL